MVSLLRIIQNFYRRFLWISLFLNLLLYLLSFSLAIVISFKLILAGLLYYSYVFADRGRQLVFYNNLGWSSEKLFVLSIVIDLTLLILTYELLERLL